jgi:hypothetical protein
MLRAIVRETQELTGFVEDMFLRKFYPKRKQIGSLSLEIIPWYMYPHWK